MDLKNFLKTNDIRISSYGNISANDLLDKFILKDKTQNINECDYYLSHELCACMFKFLSKHSNIYDDLINLLINNDPIELKNNSIYLISTKERAKKNEYKVGRYMRTLQQLISRYVTSLVNPILFFYEKVNDYITIENKILIDLDPFRIINKNGNKSEWVKLEKNKILSIIRNNINKWDSHDNIEIVDNNKLIALTNLMFIPKKYIDQSINSINHPSDFLQINKTMNKYFDFIFDHENLFVIMDNNDKIWFSGNDIAKILEYKTPQKVIEKFVPARYKKQFQDIDVDNKKYTKKYQNKSMFIDEIGLFRLSIKSKQKKAIEFQEWIINEILPELRREDNHYLEEKLHKINKINNILLIENDYLRRINKYHGDKNII
jgi:prophage antirepressor-like protein